MIKSKIIFFTELKQEAFFMNEIAPKKILIVEDSKLNEQITADILSKYGYEYV
jgi:PleD family two-component response regulator